MKNFTLRKGFLDCKSGTSSLFKGFVMLVVLMLMTTSSAMAQEAKFEVIGRTRQTLWRAVQMLTQKLCCQTIHDCPKVVPLHYESE